MRTGRAWRWASVEQWGRLGRQATFVGTPGLALRETTHTCPVSLPSPPPSETQCTGSGSNCNFLLPCTHGGLWPTRSTQTRRMGHLQGVLRRETPPCSPTSHLKQCGGGQSPAATLGCEAVLKLDAESTCLVPAAWALDRTTALLCERKEDGDTATTHPDARVSLVSTPDLRWPAQPAVPAHDFSARVGPASASPLATDSTPACLGLPLHLCRRCQGAVPDPPRLPTGC